MPADSLPGSKVTPQEMGRSFPLIGRANEYERVVAGLRRREPLLILGPAGSGKSKLLASALATLPKSEGIVLLQYSSVLHNLLIDLARALLEGGHGALRKRAHPSTDDEKWLSEQTSIHLKGILWASLDAEPRVIVLDGIEGAGFPTYRFLQRLYFVKGMALLASARDPAALGTLARLFWDPRNAIHLHPLKEGEANRIFDLAVARFGISHLDIEEFRLKVIEAANGNPGQIIEMCRLASNPIYVSGRHIKFAPLRIDVLMKFL